MQSLKRFLAEEDGPTAVEYAVLLGLILMAVVSAIGAFGGTTGAMFGNINSNMQSHGFGS